MSSPSAPADEVSEADFLTLQRLMLEQSAILLDRGRSYLVDARLRPVVRRYQLPGIAELIRALRPGDHPQLMADTVDALTTNETSFLLFPELMEPLAEGLLAPLAKAAARDPRRPLTVWSAACSSGQEPYSLAILLREHHRALVDSGRVRILASDLSPTMVMRCAAGRFSRIEVRRGLPAVLLDRHFERDGRDHVAVDELRALLAPLVINLVQPWPGIPRCDLVVLRNVLRYFPEPVRYQVIERIRRTALAPGGRLLLGDDDPILGPSDGFQPVGPAPLACYRAAEAA
ncbi:MAG: CheR family methyltransferase [Acidimicrobiales bacterium]